MNARVFFECEQSVFHEDRFNQEKVRDELISIRLTVPEDKSQFGSFVRHLQHYLPEGSLIDQMHITLYSGSSNPCMTERALSYMGSPRRTLIAHYYGSLTMASNQ